MTTDPTKFWKGEKEQRWSKNLPSYCKFFNQHVWEKSADEENTLFGMDSIFQWQAQSPCTAVNIIHQPTSSAEWECIFKKMHQICILPQDIKIGLAFQNLIHFFRMQDTIKHYSNTVCCNIPSLWETNRLSQFSKLANKFHTKHHVTM